MEPIDLRDLVAFDPEGPVHRTVLEGEHVWSELLCLEGSQGIGPIAEREADAMVVVVAGEVAVQIDRSRSRASQWTVVPVPAGSSLTIRNASPEPAVVLLIAAPPPRQRRVPE